MYTVKININYKLVLFFIHYQEFRRKDLSNINKIFEGY